MPPMTGRVIAGRYNLQHPIGRGAMGVVWRAVDQLLDRDVAVKEVVISALLSAEERYNAYQRTLREARTAARLSHRGVVAVYDVVEEDGRPWIIMELVPSRSLDQVLTVEGRLSPLRAGRIGQQLLSALAAAHRAGVLHRDVKPSNVLIATDRTGSGWDERAVLTDFGIAQFEGDPRLTQTGMVMGSPGFTAPERIRGGDATPASDLWSLGATLYAAVEGRGPYEQRGGAITTMSAIINEDAPAAPHAGRLAPIITALLRRNPAERPSAGAAGRMFAQVLPALADKAASVRTATEPNDLVPLVPPPARPAASGSADAASAAGSAAGSAGHADEAAADEAAVAPASAANAPAAPASVAGTPAAPAARVASAGSTPATPSAASSTPQAPAAVAATIPEVPAPVAATIPEVPAAIAASTPEPPAAIAASTPEAPAAVAASTPGVPVAAGAVAATPAADSAEGLASSAEPPPAAAGVDHVMVAAEAAAVAAVAAEPASAEARENAGRAAAEPVAAVAGKPVAAAEVAAPAAPKPVPTFTAAKPGERVTPTFSASHAASHAASTVTRGNQAASSTPAASVIPATPAKPAVPAPAPGGWSQGGNSQGWADSAQHLDPATVPEPRAQYAGPSREYPGLAATFPLGSGGGAASRRAGRGKRIALILAAVVVVVAIAVGAAIALSHHGGTGSPSAVSVADTKTAFSSVNALNDPTAVSNAGWRSVMLKPPGAAAGFSIWVPPGWTSSQDKLATDIVGPGGMLLEIDLTAHHYRNMVTEAKYVESGSVRAGRFPDYELLHLQGVPVRETRGAIWQFTFTNADGVKDIADDIMFIKQTSAGAQSYAIYISAPDADWSSKYLPVFVDVLRTFETDPVTQPSA